MSALDWREDAACLTEGSPEEWFPNLSPGPTARRQTESHAMTVCKTKCPVREECLTFAIESESHYGIYGGTTETERREMRKRA